MKKYLVLINVFWQRSLAYRFTVLAYRAGEMFEVLILALMWSAIYGNQTVIRGFTLQEMLTYVLVGNLFNMVVRSWAHQVVSRQIHEGTLSNFLVQPINYFHYFIFRELGRHSLPTALSVLSQLIMIAFFHSVIIINTHLSVLLVIAAMLILAFITELLISFLVGSIAFWTDETDGIYATIDRLKRFFSGGYFPLNLLPAAFFSVSYFLPFAYSIYVPTQLYLGKESIATGIQGLLAQAAWIIVLYCLIQIVWRRGLIRYEGVGI